MKIISTIITNAQIKCFGIFGLLLTPVIILIVHYSQNVSPNFWLFLFATGWFSWTFVEYCMHRFWNHSETADKNNQLVHLHLYHHTHPTEIKVSKSQRALMIIICAILISMSILFSKWLMLAAGAWAGISWFFLMHYFLHQKWAVKIFPRRVKFHIIHHCKEPEACYGVSVGWWDRLFRTLPQKNKPIAERIIDFYYRK